MSDLISKNELYKKGESLLKSFINGTKNGEQAFRDLFNAIADMPTVERKHGHWDYSNIAKQGFKCSVCNRSSKNGSPFCQWCGAIMDEKCEE